MIIVFATACLYCACFGFFHAGPRRSGFEVLKSSKSARLTLIGASWLLALLSLILFLAALGWERAIAVWIGIFSLTGIISLFIASRYAPYHKLSGKVSAVLLLVSGIGMIGGFT